MKKRAVMGLLLLSCLVFGVVIGVLGGLVVKDRPNAVPEAQQATDYPLLSKRIFVENPNDTIINFAPLRQELRGYLTQQNVDFSFYFEYLPSGTSIKINQDQKLTGASILKVPLVMNLYNAAEEGHINLDGVATIKEEDLDKNSGQLWKSGAGKQLALKEAARTAIVDSDNTAVNVLTAAAGQKFNIFEDVIDELDVAIGFNKDTQTSISAQGYASILKCLYLSCLVSYEHSEQILQWMSESSAPPRLRARLPGNIVVAHKYGTANGDAESDCGIVYVPKRPYLICVMVRMPPRQADAVIAEVSQRVYGYVSSVQGKD